MAGKNKVQQMMEDIRAKLDPFFARIGKLTKIQRIGICVATFGLIAAGYWYLVYAPKSEVLTAARAELKTQEDKLNTYKIKARSLKKFEKKMAEVQEAFNIAMRALPDKKELPSLLVGVSKAGGNAGLEFLLFQPEPIVNKEFYMEIPLSMTVSGTYHQMADFFYQVAGLNRIVNINNLSISMDATNKGRVTMKCSAVTYMFSEQVEPADGKKKKRKKG